LYSEVDPDRATAGAFLLRCSPAGIARPISITAIEQIELHGPSDRRDFSLEDFTDEDIAALEETRAPEASKAFDGELKSP
jgi:hypothetical protein